MDIRYTNSGRPYETGSRLMRLAQTAYYMIEQCDNEIESFFDWSAIHLNDHKGLLSVEIYTTSYLSTTDKDIFNKIIASSWMKAGECNYEVTYIIGNPQ